MKLKFSQQNLEICSNIKFHDNPSSGIPAVSRGQIEGRTDRQTNITKIIVTFRNFMNAPKTTLTICIL